MINLIQTIFSIFPTYTNRIGPIEKEEEEEEEEEEDLFPDNKILRRAAVLYNLLLGENYFSTEITYACMADMYLDILIDEKEFDGIFNIENLLLDRESELKASLSWFSKQLYQKIFTCYHYLGKTEESKKIHQHMYDLYDHLQKQNLKKYGVVDDTERPGIKTDYENLTKKLTKNWSFTNILQTTNAYRLKLIDKEKFEKDKIRIIIKNEEDNQIVKDFKQFISAEKFLKLYIDSPNTHSFFSTWPSQQLKQIQADSQYLMCFSSTTILEKIQIYSEYRLQRLYFEFLNFPQRKEEILSEIEYLKVINPPYFKTKTPEIEKLIKFFSKLKEDYIKEWFRIILDIEHSSNSTSYKVYVMQDKRLYEIRKVGIIKNYYQQFEIRLLPLNKLKTAILNGNYKPTKEEIEFHIWGNEGSQFIANKVLENLTGSRDIRRLSLVKKANLERLSIVLHDTFLEIEKFFEENVKEHEFAFFDHELFLKLLKASISTKKVEQARYWFDWYESLTNKHRISGQDQCANKISEEYAQLKELRKELDVCNFQEARVYAQGLQLKNKKEWQNFCAGPDKPENIPASPEQIYRDRGWINYTDFLGLTNSRKFKDFNDAREFTRSLGLKSEKEWKEYKKSGFKPEDIPAKPEKAYKNKGWCGFKDWLGYTKVQRKKFKGFKEGKEFIWKLELKSEGEWEEYKKTGLKPADIPADPGKVYREEGWCGFQDWLGFNISDRSIDEGHATAREIMLRLDTDNEKGIRYSNHPIRDFRNNTLQKNKFKDFESAKEFACSLNLQSVADWRDYKRSGRKPDDIPAKPERVYLNKGWKGFGDWLGTGNKNKNSFKSFDEARKFARSLRLRSEKEWKNYKRSGQKPDDIPANPEKVYKDAGWCGFVDWLGYIQVQRSSSSQNSQFKEFEDARRFARNLGLNTESDWREYKRSGKRPLDIPAKPENVYRDKGWNGFRDWLMAE